jgi:uncharacterized membrane protein
MKCKNLPQGRSRGPGGCPSGKNQCTFFPCGRNLVIGINILPAAAVTASKPERLESVDLLRGLVIIIMALDHVRDFFSDRFFLDPTDLATTTPAFFLTRWITHFCAPTFIFLAGTAAFLYKSRGKSKLELSWFLFIRGLWLAFLNLTVISMLWEFRYDLYHFDVGVFWCIGWSMVVLSMLVFLPTSVVTMCGAAMIVLHNLLDGLTVDQSHLAGRLWAILHSPKEVVPVVDGFTLTNDYCLVPWIGVMAIGYSFGTVLQLPSGLRQRRVFLLGVALTLGFILLRAANLYGDPSPWTKQDSPLGTFLSFLNCTKYPPSLLYLLMTLGPAIMTLAILDRPLGRLAQPIVTFGRVPLFFYLLHLLLIHSAAVLCNYVRFGWSPFLFTVPWELQADSVPQSYGVSLQTVYLIWIGVVVILYPPCRWFAEVKRRRRDFWLNYL